MKPECLTAGSQSGALGKGDNASSKAWYNVGTFSIFRALGCWFSTNDCGAPELAWRALRRRPAHAPRAGEWAMLNGECQAPKTKRVKWRGCKMWFWFGCWRIVGRELGKGINDLWKTLQTAGITVRGRGRGYAMYCVVARGNPKWWRSPTGDIPQ